MKDIDPNIIVLDEVIDFYSLSKFDKDPRRELNLQHEIEQTKEILGNIRKTFPKAEIKMVESNHDLRLQKFLYRNSKPFYYLDVLSVYSLLELGKFRITYLKDFVFRGVLFKHGDMVRKDSSQTAKAQQIKEGMSGASGHSHRLGQFFKTVRGGSYVWLEGGCMCITQDVEYIEGTADWQNGFCGFTFEDGKSRFYPFVVPIIDGKAVYGKKVYQ